MIKERAYEISFLHAKTLGVLINSDPIGWPDAELATWSFRVRHDVSFVRQLSLYMLIDNCQQLSINYHWMSLESGEMMTE